MPEIDEFLQSQVVNCFGKPPATATSAPSEGQESGAEGTGKSTSVSASNAAYRQVKIKADELQGDDEGDIELGLEKKNVESLTSQAVVSDDILRAGRLSHAHKFVSDFPQGYHTEVGEGSIMISGKTLVGECNSMNMYGKKEELISF